MSATPAAAPMLTDSLRGALQAALAQVNTLLLGKPQEVRLAFVALLSDGHLLIEDLPGLGKTMLAHALAATLGLGFQRVQFTSDLLPSDIVGVSVYDAHARRFEFHPGPVFAHVLLADEINRAPPRTQSALLEAMAEHQITVDGSTHPLPEPFFVIATQNPFDLAGTYPLPDSQLDRFVLRLALGYPGEQAERDLLAGADRRELIASTPPLLGGDGVLTLRRAVNAVHASDPLIDYMQALLLRSRRHPGVRVGLSPRAGIALLRAARAHALLLGRDHVLPEDVQALFAAVAAHRLVADAEGGGNAALAKAILHAVAVDSRAMSGALRSWLRRRFRTWARPRQPETLPVRLDRSRVYVLPTGFGLFFALLLVTMALGALNYNNNPALLLCLLLAGAANTSLLVAHLQLSGLVIDAIGAEPVAAGTPLTVRVHAQAPPGRERRGLRVDGGADADGSEGAAILSLDDDAGEAILTVPTVRRGWLDLQRLRISTTRPLGLARAWAYVWTDAPLLVYPAPEPHGPPLPTGAGEQVLARLHPAGDDVHHLRAYRRGDARRAIAWKPSARHAVLLVREYEQPLGADVVLDWVQLPPIGYEARIQRLARWIDQAEREGRRYRLILPAQPVLGPASGAAHRHACLRALALLPHAVPDPVAVADHVPTP